MFETSKNNSPEQGQSGWDEQRQSDWDVLTGLSNGSSAKQAPGDTSYDSHFQQEAMAHRKNAEDFYRQASQRQKDQLTAYGIRDPQDAGEVLHEMASWNRQVEQRVNSINENIYGNLDIGVEGIERMLIERGNNNGVNPITGERLEDSPFSPIEDDDARKLWEDDFQRWQEEFILPDTIAIETKAVSAMIRGELQIQDSEKTQEAVTPRSAEALEKEAIDKWIAATSGDADQYKKLHDSVFYATLKRKIQREAEERAKAESTTA